MARRLSFSKMHGAGNDFVILALLGNDPQLLDQRVDLPKLSQALLDRHFGVGADQLMLIQPSDRSDFAVSIFNADGSSARMCGNGVRCVIRYLISNGLSKSDHIVLDVAGKEIPCQAKDEGRWVSVDMGVPEFNPEQLGIHASTELIGHSLQVSSESFAVTVVGISGSLHCVVLVSNLQSFDLEKFGPLLERYELFPNRANVEFVEKLSNERVSVRVWERGSGPTLACGSGACGVVAALARQKQISRRALVEMPGGVLEVSWGENNQIVLSGPAEEVFQGELSIDFMERLQ